uniref:G-protein coupled receptors family 1 profile domain-containing protein n=1 Tax=Biomphalaria glabrata TaxID=6526 RepID=A0A2C9LV64_BIOGL
METKVVPADFTNNVILRDTLSSLSETKAISLNGSKEETFKNSSCVTPKHAPNTELDQSGLISNTDLSLYKDTKNTMKNISIVHARDNASAAAGALKDGKTINGKIGDGKMVEVVEMDGTVHVTVQTEASAGQFDGAVCLMNPKNKEQGRRRVELKAALKVGLLFCSCVCLWAPLPVFVVYMRETSGWRDKLKVDLLVIFSALATSTAAMDPIVYGLLNRQIRIAAFASTNQVGSLRTLPGASTDHHLRHRHCPELQPHRAGPEAAEQKDEASLLGQSEALASRAGDQLWGGRFQDDERQREVLPRTGEQARCQR